MLNEHEKRGFLRAGELARAAGVSTDTLRHYEREGVLARPRRSRNGYREYPPESLARVRLVRRALGVGFTLKELARVLRVRDGGGTPCREVRAMAAAKLNDIEARLRELRLLRDELRDTLADWDARLTNTEVKERAGLLETLAASDPARSDARARLARRPPKKRERSHNDDVEN